MNQPGETPLNIWVHRLIKVLASFVALIIFALLAFYIYLSTRPPAKTVRSMGTISIPTPFRLTRPFIDYMALRGQMLYVAFASHNLVGVINTNSGRAIATIEGLSRVHGVALVPDLNLAFASAGKANGTTPP